MAPHIPESRLELYSIGSIVDEAELAPLEEHLLACPSCLDRAIALQQYVDALRPALRRLGVPVARPRN